MIPYHDENQTLRPAYVTIALVGACVATWFLAQGGGGEEPLAASVCNYGLIPGELTESLRPGSGFQMTRELACLIDPGPQYLNVLTSMFMHGGWMHLIGNMWFLWLFGNNVEDAMTRPRFLAFYLICGLAAAALQVATDPSSEIPMVGASGAISGVMGAYLVLYPRVRVFTFIPLGFIMTSVALPAWGMLIYWMALQLFGVLGSAMAESEGGGVAFWAHIGGFVAGVLLVKFFTRPDHLDAHKHAHWRPQNVGL